MIAAEVVLDGLRVGDSVAVSGACLTAIEVTGDGFAVDRVAETLRRTTLGGPRRGTASTSSGLCASGPDSTATSCRGNVDGVGTVRAGPA